MAISVDDANATTATGLTTATLTLAYPTGISSGDLLLVFEGNDSQTATAQFDDVSNKPTGFTWIASGGDTASDTAAGAFYRVADGTESGSVTCTAQSAVDHWAIMVRVTGVDSTTPIDVVGTVQLDASSSTHSAPAVTTTVDGCEAFYQLSFDGGDGPTFGTPTGWTKGGGADIQAGTGAANVSGTWGHKTQTTAGSTGAASISSAVTDGAASFQFALTPASTGSPVTDTAEVASMSWSGVASTTATGIVVAATLASAQWFGVEATTATGIVDTATVAGASFSGVEATTATGVVATAQAGASAWSGTTAASSETAAAAADAGVATLSWSGVESVSTSDVVTAGSAATLSWFGVESSTSELIGATADAGVATQQWSGTQSDATSDVIASGHVAGVSWSATVSSATRGDVASTQIASLQWFGTETTVVSVGLTDGSAVTSPALALTLPTTELALTLSPTSSSTAMTLTLPTTDLTLTLSSTSSSTALALTLPTTAMEVPVMGLHVNDTAPLLTATLTSGGSAVDLTGATIVFHLEKPDGTTATLAATADAPTTGGTITGAAWGSTLDTAGTWKAEAQVTYSDSTIQTFGPVAFAVLPEIA